MRFNDRWHIQWNFVKKMKYDTYSTLEINSSDINILQKDDLIIKFNTKVVLVVYYWLTKQGTGF